MGDTLIVMFQIDGYLSNTDLSELGRVAYPTTQLAFRMPASLPQEWVSKGVKKSESNELTITISLASDSGVNSDQQTAGVFGEEPDFKFTCSNQLTCNLGATNCACSSRQTCANNGVCTLNICSPPATPAPTTPTNAVCVQSTPSALGACAAANPSALLSCQCVGSSGLTPCTGSQSGSCQQCTAGQPFCACTGANACSTANFQCLGGRCFPNYGCANCPCQQGVCDTNLMCDAASQICLPTGSTPAQCTPGGNGCACKSGGICNDASLYCISGTCRQCQDGLETCNCINGATCQGSLICNASTKKCQRANCQEGTQNCPCTAAQTCSLSTLRCNSIICVPDGQPFTTATTTPPRVITTQPPQCPLGNESCKCKSDGTCNGAALKCVNTFCQPSCMLGDEGCPCASLNGTPACTSPTLRCMTTTTNTCEKTGSSSSVDTSGSDVRLVQAVTVVIATLVLAFA